MAKIIKKLNLSRSEENPDLHGRKYHLHIVFMLNLKFQPDKFKNNEENEIIVLAARGPCFSKITILYHIFIM
jgi:predicted oxidoreductase